MLLFYFHSPGRTTSGEELWPWNLMPLVCALVKPLPGRGTWAHHQTARGEGGTSTSLAGLLKHTGYLSTWPQVGSLCTPGNQLSFSPCFR